MKKLLFICFVYFLSLPVFAEHQTKLTWHGHAAFEIITPKGAVLMIDPWLTNPQNPKKDAVANVTKLDYILITHGHFDHTGDSVALAKATKARLVANFELGTNMARVLGYPADQMGFDTLMNSGGEIKIANGEVTVAMTPAVHSSSLDPSNEKNKNLPVVYGGNPNGFIIKIENGPTFYHTGDTAFFKDMELLARYEIDVALTNIGGHFGMEPDMAAMAVKAVGAKWAIPHHFKTFPILTQDSEAFKRGLKRSRAKMIEMKPGETLVFQGSELKR